MKYSGLKEAIDMIASGFAAPKLSKDAMDREIKSIQSEYKMCFSSDITRILQVLQFSTANDDHIFNRFCWGNLESLKGENEETLWDDLKEFYDN